MHSPPLLLLQILLPQDAAHINCIQHQYFFTIMYNFTFLNLNIKLHLPLDCPITQTIQITLALSAVKLVIHYFVYFCVICEL